MTKQTRKAATGLAILATMFAAGRPAAAADGSSTNTVSPAPSMSRVRSTNPAIASLMIDASAKSATFRELVQTIDASDGIVYVEPGECGHGVRACLVGVAPAGPNRMLHIKVDPRKEKSDLMGSIGHELRHATEVLAERSVTNSAAMFFFYMRDGVMRGGAFETQAAIDAGDAVRSQVRRSMRAAQER
jgi:hypothetical protein